MGTACYTPSPSSCPILRCRHGSAPWGFPGKHWGCRFSADPVPPPKLHPASKGTAVGLQPCFAVCPWVPSQHMPQGPLPVPPTVDPCLQGCPFPTLTPLALQQTF